MFNSNNLFFMMQSIVGKVAYGLDGTNITFTSSEYVQRVFAGAPLDTFLLTLSIFFFTYSTLINQQLRLLIDAAFLYSALLNSRYLHLSIPV